MKQSSQAYFFVERESDGSGGGKGRGGGGFALRTYFFGPYESEWVMCDLSQYWTIWNCAARGVTCVGGSTLNSTYATVGGLHCVFDLRLSSEPGSISIFNFNSNKVQLRMDDDVLCEYLDDSDELESHFYDTILRWI